MKPLAGEMNEHTERALGRLRCQEVWWRDSVTLLAACGSFETAFQGSSATAAPAPALVGVAYVREWSRALGSRASALLQLRGAGGAMSTDVRVLGCQQPQRMWLTIRGDDSGDEPLVWRHPLTPRSEPRRRFALACMNGDGGRGPDGLVWDAVGLRKAWYHSGGARSLELLVQFQSDSVVQSLGRVLLPDPEALSLDNHRLAEESLPVVPDLFERLQRAYKANDPATYRRRLRELLFHNNGWRGLSKLQNLVINLHRAEIEALGPELSAPWGLDCFAHYPRLLS